MSVSRGAAEASEVMDGAGLGLAIVLAVAEAHGGSVSLENPASGGALVTLLLKIPAGRTTRGEPIDW